jgi:amino acid adenylation domain-containing protein
LIEDRIHACGPARTSLRLDRLFEEQAARTPNAVALIHRDDTMTFSALASAAGRMAELIRANGLPSGSLIGLHMERSFDYVASVLGILKTNSAVVALPPSFPQQRLRQVLSLPNLDAVIGTGKGYLDPTMHRRVLRVSDAVAAPGSPDYVPVTGTPDDPAFVLCSSGSTGTPKMIVRSHRSFFHRLEWTWKTHPYASGEVCCQKATTTTTHAVYELFEPLLRGVPVCIIPDEETRALESFWDTIRRRAVSRLLAVPSMLQASLDMPNFVPPDIKVLVLMGEYVQASLATRAIAAFPSATRIYSIYGSTEASSTLVCDLRASTRPGHELPLGRPISNDIQVRVLDENLQPAPVDSTGILYLAGPALFSGYLNDAALTSAAFITHDGMRWYCTNDRVRRTIDDELQYLGRIDDTVKVRGFRVDLQEVENSLAMVPGVHQCAAVARKSGEGDSTLVAFVTPEDLRPADIYRTLREKLPDYMVPSRVIGLAAMPRTSSGKIDRRELLELCGRSRKDETPKRFHSDTEQRLSDIWKIVLGHETFERDSMFFEVGGTSLKTFSVIARLRGDLALERHQLPDNIVYRFPTIAGLAAYLDHVRDGGAAGAAGADTILVTLKQARDTAIPPLFVISSAGGTLGAYEKVVRALETTREVIGVRDPYLWGGRDPASGFSGWITQYLTAIRERQPEGPYYLLAYSSAAALGYELARQLRGSGEKIALLALIDPLAMDRSSKWRFGYWVLEARFMRPEFARLVALVGRLRRFVPHPHRQNASTPPANSLGFTQQQFLEFENKVKKDKRHILQLSALLELNTGLPIALKREELDLLEPEQYLDALLTRVRRTSPDVNTEMIKRLVVQYPLQVRSQHHYRLRPFDGALALIAPDDPYYALLASQFKPCVAKLVEYRVPMSLPSNFNLELGAPFADPLRSHFLSMRDDAFAHAVARHLDMLLRTECSRTLTPDQTRDGAQANTTHRTRDTG